MSSVLDRWPYSRRSLWIVLGAVVAVVVAIVVAVVMVTGRSGSPTASASSSEMPDDQLPPPTPIPVETVAPGPAPTAEVTVAPITDTVVTAGPDDGATAAGVTVRLVSLRPIETQAYERGDASGPGLAVTFVVTNNSDAPLDLTSDVNLYSGAEGRPGVPMSLDGHNSPFPKATLAKGESAERTAVFATPNAAGTPVAVQVLLGESTYSLQATVGS